MSGEYPLPPESWFSMGHESKSSHFFFRLKENIMSFDRIKEHVKKHKVAYICGATMLVTAGITTRIMRERHAVLRGGADGPDVATMRSFSFNFLSKGSGNVVATISREGRGHPGYATRWIEGMIDYETQGLAALEHGVPASLMSAHIQGKFPDIDGNHFERINVAA